MHDYVNLDGGNLAKSAGNSLTPGEIVDHYGVDALRWSFVREVPLLGDTDYSSERVVNAYDNDLAWAARLPTCPGASTERSPMLTSTPPPPPSSGRSTRPTASSTPRSRGCWRNPTMLPLDTS